MNPFQKLPAPLPPRGPPLLPWIKSNAPLLWTFSLSISLHALAGTISFSSTLLSHSVAWVCHCLLFHRIATRSPGFCTVPLIIPLMEILVFPPILAKTLNLLSPLPISLGTTLTVITLPDTLTIFITLLVSAPILFFVTCFRLMPPNRRISIALLRAPLLVIATYFAVMPADLAITSPLLITGIFLCIGSFYAFASFLGPEKP